MRKVAIFSLLLIAGMVGAQLLPSLVGDTYAEVSHWLRLATMVALAFIMIHVAALVIITWLLAIFGEVEHTGTSTRGMEELSLSNGVVFPPFRWTGKRGETSKRPRFTKTGQEPLWVVPRVGERTAELMETPIMLVVIMLAARWVARRLALASTPPTRLGVGGVALGF